MTTPNQPKPNTGKTLKPSKFAVKKFTEERVYPNSSPDDFGQVRSGDKDRSRIGKPPETSAQDHYHSDLDSGPQSQHHTLGTGRNQSSPGNHIHDGVTSRMLFQSGMASVSFTAQSSFTQAVTFPIPFAEPPQVFTNIASNNAVTARWGSRAISITETGFTLFVFEGDAADPAQTWVSIPVQWFAS